LIPQDGATDYVLKERLARLAPAVRRAMQEVEKRTESRRTEEKLRESEQRLRIVFSQSPLGIALVGADGRPVLTSGPAADARLHGRGTDGCLSPNSRIGRLRHGPGALPAIDPGTRKSYQIEKRYLRKDGQMVWARLSVSLARGGWRDVFAIGMVRGYHGAPAVGAQFIEAQKNGRDRPARQRRGP